MQLANYIKILANLKCDFKAQNCQKKVGMCWAKENKKNDPEYKCSVIMTEEGNKHKGSFQFLCLRLGLTLHLDLPNRSDLL
jgi:hypothetical protein